MESLRCPPGDNTGSGSTQSNDPWITKSVLPTAHSHVQNRIKDLMARSYRFSFCSLGYLLRRVHRFHGTKTAKICHTSCIIDE